MVSERDRILKLTEFIESLGIKVNISKNNARGYRGYFMYRGLDSHRIDISKKLKDEEILRTLLHEFIHYIHFSFCRNLDSLEFVFGEKYSCYENELINVTVDSIPKKDAKSIFNRKEQITSEINVLVSNIKSKYPNFKKTNSFKDIEANISKPLKYLLKYDRVKVNDRIYSVDNLENDFDDSSKEELFYVKLKSKQRAIKRINSKIARINKYYNNSSELFARFCEVFFIDKEKSCKLAPNATKYFDDYINNTKIKEFIFLKNLFDNLK